MNNSDRRTIGIIAVIVTTLLCACPGLFLMFGGGITGLVAIIPGADLNGNEVGSVLGGGITALCLGLFLVAIPLVVALFAFRGGPGKPRSAVLDATPPPPPQPVRPVEPEPVNTPPFVVLSSEPPPVSSTEDAVIIVDSEEPPVEPEESPTFEERPFEKRPDESQEDDRDSIPPAI